MDDDCKDYKKNKPQQRFYKPGSGPLRRSRYGLDSRMESCDIDNGPRAREPNYGSQHSINGEETPNSRYRKPEQQLYVPRIGDSCSDIDKQYKNSLKCDSSSQHYNKRMTDKKDNINLPGGTGFSSKNGGSDFSYKDGSNNDVNYNRHYRQGSEARSISPTQSLSNQKSLERNRDSKSMETWAGRHKTGSGGKPPSGRRNSAGFSSDSRPKHLINLDNIPPRFRKKYSEQSGHQSFDNVDQLNRDRCSNDFQSYHTGQFYGSNNTNWSQTLPSRGRGRLRDNEHFDREKFINSYLKNSEGQSSRRSTPSNSYVNLYETIPPVNNSAPKMSDFQSSDIEHSKTAYDNDSSNFISHSNEVKHNHKDSDDKTEGSDNQNDSEPVSNISTNLSDMTLLDWTEEVEKNIKLDEMCDSSTSFSQSLKSSNPQDKRSAPPPEPKKSNNKSRRRDRRSSSRGNINSDKRERNRKDSNVSVQYEPERSRRDSNVSIQQETQPYGLKHRDRERRDSHRSNRSSTIGNSRDDLDRWRCVRSYSREQSSERRIVSQCNSRDVSTNRALSPKDSDGFRVPSTSGKSATWSNQANQKKSNVAWNGGRTPSIDRKHSPTPSVSGEGGEGAGSSAGCGGGGGGGRRSRKRTGRRRRNAENLQPTPYPPGAVPAPTNINWRDEIIESKKHQSERQPEINNQRNRLNSVLSEKSVTEPSNQPGLIVLPQSSMSHLQKEQGRGENMETRKTLFDHQNPSKPIIVQTSPTKNDIRMERGVKEASRVNYETGDTSRGARHVALLQKVDRADAILKMHTMRGPLTLAANWPDVVETRKFLQSALQRLLMSDLKYCQADNIEHQFWKILYYHFIENLRKSISQVTPEEKPQVVKLINTIIEEGNIFFENLIHMLEKTYKFNTEDHINDNHNLPPKGLGYVGLALISVQKLYVFLGDLARYKEQVNESNNYAKSKFWYTKAQQINPKNGRPYNQLAILAIYARRKLDAVYYYMRSLMSSNPFQSARESLLSLFDENRKKYEAAERKRRAAAESVKSGEIGTEVDAKQGAGLRREVWVRASGHRTTTLRPATEDTLANISPVELNKNFITSYLYVHGKLITKVDMETFHTSAAHMLRQFRALLHRQPLPTPSARLLQLTALNMYAVETNSASLKGNNGGERSGWLDCALGVSLLMFGALLERCCALLPEPADTQQHADALLLLPAIKVWSDWMLCHSSVWNPPPCLDNFEIESENDPWDWLAKLMNILEALDDKSIEIENESKEGYVPVRLPEDSSLAGFTPLMYMEPVAAWLPSELPIAPHTAEHVLRTRRLLFFGTEYLVGVEPPVLKLEYPAGAQPRYVSAVERTQPNLPLQQLSEDSADEESVNDVASGPPSLGEVPDGADETTRKLLRRKEQLESRKATLERRRQRMQEMLSTGWVSVEVVVRPRWLVPDTNCFIDHLSLLQQAAQPNAYQLAVPLVVVSELEGLRRCSRVGEAARTALAWVSAEGSGSAGNVRLATARGSLLAARGLAFTEEQDQTRSTNDDRVLATALNLQANLANDSESVVQESHDKCVRRVREVVLLTDDRNLRVKALAAELPARDLPSFVQWAGLHSEASKANTASAIPDVN